MEAFGGPVRRGILAVLVFTFFSVGVFSPFLAQGRLLAPGDAQLLSLPHYYATRSLWTSHIYSGFPASADPQTFTYYPLAALLAAIPNSFNLFVLTAFVLSGCFTFGLVHRLTQSRLAGILAGAVYALGGFSITHLGHTNMLHAACWLPLGLWTVDVLRTTVTPRNIALAAAVVALSLLSGHPQITAYQLALSGIYGFVLSGPSWRERGRLTVVILASSVLGLGMGAVLLVPMAELTAQSARSHMDFNDFVSLALPPNQWPQLLLPGLHGGSFDLYLGRQAPTFGSGGGVLEATGYVGLLPWALAAVAVTVGVRRQPQVRFWLAVAVVALLLAFGKATPLGSLTFQIPVWNRFRIPTRHLMEFTLALAVLAGFGVAALQQCDAVERRRLVRRALIGLSAFVILAVIWFSGMVAFGLYTRHMPASMQERVNLSALPWRNAAVAVPLVVLIVSAAALGVWGRRPSAATSALLTVVLLLDLGSFAWLYLSPKVARVADLRCPELVERHARELRANGQRLLPLDPYRVSGGAPPNLSRLWETPSLSGYCPLVLRRYSELTGINYIGFDDYRFLDPQSRVLDVLAAHCVLAPRSWAEGSHPTPDPTIAAALQDRARFRKIADSDELIVFQNLRARPRAWLVSETRSLSSEEVCRTIRTGRLPDGEPFNPADVALVSDTPSREYTVPYPTASVRIVHTTENRVELETHSTTAAFLVLSDADYPGWRADVDGQPSRIIRTNYVSRGVEVPPGVHRVRFVYRPVSAMLGAALSAVCTLLTLGLFVIPIRRPARVSQQS